jgi:hypothetical protein
VSSRLHPLAAVAALGLAAAVAASTYLPSCQTYVPPPTATVVGLTNGILAKASAPIVVQFSTPVDPATVRIDIAPFDIDAFGNLPDELPDAGPLNPLVTYSQASETNVTGSWSADHATLTLTTPMNGPLAYLPTGPSLVLLVAPGLTSSTTGAVLRYRERIPFSYPAVCGAAQHTQFHSGDYFFILQVNSPVPVVLKVFAAIDVSPLTGEFYGQFTAALRNSDPARCNPACTNGLVCELIPSSMCVMMSQPPASVYESPDFVPKATAPNGYTFEMHGCATDVGDAGAVNILTQPGVLDVTSPAVSIQGLTFTAQFTPVDGGLIQGSGSLTATKTFLGSDDLGAGAGTLSALSIPDAEAPPDLPQPGILGDGGADGGDVGATDGGAG